MGGHMLPDGGCKMMNKRLLAGLGIGMGAALAVSLVSASDASACGRRWSRGCASYYAPPVAYGYGSSYGYVPPAPVYGWAPPPSAYSYYTAPYAAPVRGYGYRAESYYAYGRGHGYRGSHCRRGYGYRDSYYGDYDD